MDTLEKRPSAVDRAYDWLRDQLLARRVAPHDVITEAQVADAVGVSRTPVREALIRLEGEGFLRLLPKRGALILPVTAEETADVLETRGLVETYAVAQAIARPPADLLDRLAGHLAHMRSAAATGDTREYVEADRAFHAAIVAATGNSILIALYRSLRDRQLRMGVTNLSDTAGVSTQRMASTIDEHAAILDALRAGDASAAAAAVSAHLETAARALDSRGRS
jgi:DNA-binding GntR family transcriptional regulator